MSFIARFSLSPAYSETRQTTRGAEQYGLLPFNLLPQYVFSLPLIRKIEEND